MDILKNIIIIATLELRRAFTTRRGLAVIFAFALIWALLLRYGVFGAAEWLRTGGNAIGAMINSRTVTSLLNWEVPEFAVFWIISLYLFPMLCLTLAADQTSSDRARGTLRLVSLHATRGSIFFGRYIGLLVVQYLLLLLVIAATVIVVVIRDQSMLPVAMETAVMVFVNLCLLIAAYTAAMAVISLFTKSARQATTWAIILWLAIGILIFWLGRYFPQADSLKWILPGAHIKHLLHHTSWQSLQLAIVPLLQTAALLTSGYIVMKVRDL